MLAHPPSLGKTLASPLLTESWVLLDLYLFPETVKTARCWYIWWNMELLSFYYYETLTPGHPFGFLSWTSCLATIADFLR